MNSVAADLHCHTKMSDGSASIDEVVLMAKKLGLKTIAVTDHDTFAGATRACVYGRRQGIEVIHARKYPALIRPEGGRCIFYAIYVKIRIGWKGFSKGRRNAGRGPRRSCCKR